MKKKNLFVFILVFLFFVGSSLTSVSYNAKAATSNIIKLGFIPSDSVMDPNRPIMYVVSSDSKSVYSINYSTGEIKKLDFSLQPERITIANDKIYVTLLKIQHDIYTFSSSGAVGIIDAATFTVSGQFDIDMDPYDIEADASGRIYITPGSGQGGNLEVYSAVTKTKIAQAQSSYSSSLIKRNPVNSKVYLITTQLSPRDMETYGFSGDTFTHYYSSNSDDYFLNTNMRISPDGRFIFNGSGNIFNCTNLGSSDMTYAGKLNKSFTDISFGSGNIYTGLSDGDIAVYNYSDFQQTGTISTSGCVQNLYYKNNSLISLSKFSDNSFGIEIINSLPKNATNIIKLGFVPSDSVIDPNRSIMYAVSSNSKSVYSINYLTKEIRKVDFNLQPERITIANDKIYVTLLEMQHQISTTDTLKGAVGIIDASTFKVSGQFDIDTDPYDIKADSRGRIYITPGSNQWGNLEIYSAVTKTKIGQGGPTYMSSLIQFNPIKSKVYLTTTAASPRVMESYGFSQGVFQRLCSDPYNGKYALNTNTRISPDGIYIFNGSGNIFRSTYLQSTDMTYVGKLNNSFTDISFSTGNIYAGLNDGNIAVYSYNKFEQLGTIATSGKVQNLYYKDNSLISLSKFSDNTFGVEVIKSLSKDGTNIVKLGFVPSDSIVDPNRPIIYAVSANSKSVYSINYLTGEIKKADFTLQPERITIANDKIYVTLLKMQHDSYIFSSSGAVGIIDASTFKVLSKFDIDMDPYDIEADANGRIYITPGSGQFGNLEVYSAVTKTKIGQAVLTNEGSFIQFNPVNSKVYLITTYGSPTYMENYGFSQNVFKRFYTDPYWGDYELNSNMRISPDGKYIFNGSGNIFNATNLQSSDMTYAGKLSNPFTDVSFGLNKVYAGLSDGNIAVYDYNNFTQTGTINTNGKIKNVYFRKNLLVSISQLPDYSYAVETIKP